MLPAQCPSLRIHAEFMELACPLHSLTAAANVQAPRDLTTEPVLLSGFDQPGKSHFGYSGGTCAPATHENDKSAPQVFPTSLPFLQCYGAIQPHRSRHTCGWQGWGDMLGRSCCLHVLMTSSWKRCTWLPPHRLSIHTPPASQGPRPSSPSSKMLDSGHCTPESKWLRDTWTLDSWQVQ
jgi:hypothetical protein